MTFDLFADAPVPAPAAESFMMEPCGLNLWNYRGVVIRCDMKLQGLIGHWQTVEPLGLEGMKSDRRVALCKMINDRLDGRAAP